MAITIHETKLTPVLTADVDDHGNVTVTVHATGPGAVQHLATISPDDARLLADALIDLADVADGFRDEIAELAGGSDQ